MRFAAAILLGAFLLFQVQPILGKFVTPWFGGGASVWLTCLLFFAPSLFAGMVSPILTRLALDDAPSEVTTDVPEGQAPPVETRERAEHAAT